MVGTYFVLCSGCPRIELCRGVWFTMGPAILSFPTITKKKCVNNGNKKTILFFVSLNIFIILAITINIIIVNCISFMLLLIVKCTTDADAGNVPIVIKSLINIPNRGTVSKFKSSSFSLPFVYHLPRRPPQLPPIQFKS